MTMIPRYRYTLTARELSDAWRASRKTAECGKFLQALSCAAPHERIWPTASGKSALWLALSSLGQQGKEVVIPGYACPVVADTVLNAGYIPHFADVRKEDFSYDPASLARAMDKDTAAVVSVYIAGMPHDPGPARDECRARGIPLIEDCCQALGSRDKNGMVGAGADMAVYSFGIGKELHSGGGMLASAGHWSQAIDKEYESFRAPATHEWMREAVLGYAYSALSRRAFTYGLIAGAMDPMDRMQKRTPRTGSYRTRMAGFSRCLAVARIAGLQEVIAARHSRVQAWKQALAGMPHISWPIVREGASPSFLRMILYVTPALRGPFIRWCRKGGIECLSKAEPMPWQHMDKGRYLSEHLPTAQEINDSVVSLPADECVTDKEFAYMAGYVKRFNP